MLSYIIRRLIQMVPILLGVAFLTFALFTIFGEDPVVLALGNHASAESIAELQHRWGLDQPLYMQFLDFLKQIVTFDYGESYSTGENITEIFSQGALVSLTLTAPPFILGTLVNLVIAMYIAYHRGSVADKVATVIFIISMSISYLVYIIAFQYILAYQMDLFPIQGFEWGVETFSYLGLPWLIMIIVAMGPDIRVYRTVFLDETKSDYVRTARAKGASENSILFIHVMKNAMIPVLTNTVVAIPFLIMGAFLMERFFSLPGIGDTMITAINEGDFPILKALTMLTAILYAGFNLLTDLMYAVVDPRVQLD
jgi:peptide/nickel transport system permease protein